MDVYAVLHKYCVFLYAAEPLEKCVGDVAARFELRYVVLFGSRALGYAAEFSDWDLAVKVGRRISLTELGRLYGGWRGAFPGG